MYRKEEDNPAEPVEQCEQSRARKTEGLFKKVNGGVAQWKNICLVCVRPCVQSPAPKNK
jgi:hypothetical protein